jgi:hypothetical protein
MTQPSVLQFVIVGQEDHPLYEADLTAKLADAVREVSSIPTIFHRFFCDHRNTALSLSLLNNNLTNLLSPLIPSFSGYFSTGTSSISPPFRPSRLFRCRR